ncbi:MAG: F0F1 ATP synthase subunit B [Alphaproteobacteria bacterium CG11_big_fil_rev_8_21_14_0_20_39_49]|nr:MAG: F0F1 ATP synthase subunit B [Alphaproteobacteria bacterium CG11_big_fil_rev_8_21_14_0_20_39_49]
MFYDPTFWVAVSFVVFIALVYKPVGNLIVDALDKRSLRIKNELGEALRLKEEAQALLASYQRKQKEMAEEAESIVAEAEAEAKRIAKEAEKELDITLNKRVEMAMQKIAAYEASIVQQVKDNSVDIAISTVRAIVMDTLNKEASEELIGHAISGIGKKLH